MGKGALSEWTCLFSLRIAVLKSSGFDSVVLGRYRNLVDPASSHMFVSKIKPCMFQNKLFYGKSANGSLKQLYSTR